VTKTGTGTWDAGTRGRGDAGTRGRGDAGTGGLGDAGTRGRGTRGRGDVGIRGRGTPGRWNSETWLDARGLEDVINKQHLTFALNLKNTIFGGQV